jgi:hypothetical protein
LAVRWSWSNRAELPIRLPGAMATLFSDESVRVPVGLELEAADERDRLMLRVEFDSFVELVVPDNEHRQYTRIGEASGPVRIELEWQERRLCAEGYAYGEFTH